MRHAGLRGLAALPRWAKDHGDSRYGYPIAPNRLARNFQIVGWSMRETLHTHRPERPDSGRRSASGPRTAASTTPTGASSMPPRPIARPVPGQGLPRP